MRIIKILFVSAILSAVVLLYGSCIQKDKAIVISGSRTMESLILTSAEIFEKSGNCRIQVSAQGSLKGLAVLIEGKCDLASSSTKMPANLMWEAQKKGQIIKECIIGYDILIPIVHPSNTVNNLFLGQLSDIYTGLIKNWSDVAGKQQNILVVDRDDYSGTKEVMSERFFQSKSVAAGSVKMKTDTEIVAYVAQHPRAVGYISKSCNTTGVKSITINGISATRENVEKGYYPLYRELYLYVNSTSFKGTIKSYIDFILSSRGQRLVKEAGFMQVSDMNQTGK
jgi:phosphate transport system substrate-binding protein